MKNLLLVIITLLSSLLLIPAIAFADEKITAREKTAPASAKKGKVKEKCVIPKLEHEKKLPSGGTVTIKDPIPNNLSDKCYCKAVLKQHIIFKPNPDDFWPNISKDFNYDSWPKISIYTVDYFYHKNYRAFKCLATHFFTANGLANNKRDCLNNEYPGHFNAWCNPQKGLITFAPSSP